MTDTSWIPAPALAREIGIHRRTLARWIGADDGSFPKPKIINHRLYFQRHEIEAWKAGVQVKFLPENGKVNG
jgi:predicted DNA-binding transcriptional regulator AlpA